MDESGQEIDAKFDCYVGLGFVYALRASSRPRGVNSRKVIVSKERGHVGSRFNIRLYQ